MNIICSGGWRTPTTGGGCGGISSRGSESNRELVAGKTGAGLGKRKRGARERGWLNEERLASQFIAQKTQCVAQPDCLDNPRPRKERSLTLPAVRQATSQKA
jgi:hypothetical protein